MVWWCGGVVLCNEVGILGVVKMTVIVWRHALHRRPHIVLAFGNPGYVEGAGGGLVVMFGLISG